MGISFKSQEVLDTMISLCEKHLVPPTHRMVQDALGFKSPNSVTQHYNFLIEAGLIEHNNVSRGYIPVSWKRRIEAMQRLCAGVSTDELATTDKITLPRK